MPSNTISQNTYILGVTKQTILTDLFKTFYTLVNRNVNPKTATTNKFWYPTFPYHSLYDGALDYPIGVMDIPSLSWDKFTIQKKWAKGTVNFEIYSVKSSDADDLGQQIINAIDKERKTLWTLNVRKVTLSTYNTDFIMRDEVKLHIRTMEFTFQYPFTHGLFE